MTNSTKRRLGVGCNVYPDTTMILYCIQLYCIQRYCIQVNEHLHKHNEVLQLIAATFSWQAASTG